MADEFITVCDAADLALQSNSDESVTENESNADDNLLLSDSDVGDIFDEERSDPDAPSMSVAAQVHVDVNCFRKAMGGY